MLVRYPIHEEQLKALTGEPVYAVMHDGSFCCGTIDDVKDGQLRMTGFRGRERLSLEPGTAQAQVSEFGLEQVLFRGGMWLELKSLAFLFNLPSMLFMI
ncbi:hypothetical protein [Ferviditalea candida]|uniref:Uncharacterized protein n=1 Tax=Ferviditalea candida TaxID=3108399 RepID=A0ABU5ZJ70_9BACL|nr:hypothetical protein [Paenibacillaceae bacterium T2]